MRRTVVLILLLVVAGTLAAQDSAEWYLNQTIVDVRFVGLSNVSESEIRPIVDPFVGHVFTWRRFEDLQNRLYALDFFTSIIPEAIRPESGDGVVVQFTVEENPAVDEVRFVGNRRIRTNDLLSVTLLKVGDMITLTKQRADEQAIYDLYLERGYPDVDVTSSVVEEETDRGTEHVVVFHITEGRQVTVREIRFSGNDFASDTTLRSQMDTKAQSIFNSGAYQSTVLEEDKIRIVTYYQERGYVDAQVVDVTQEVERDEERDRNYLILTVYIEEGSQYTLAGFTFEGNALYSSEELRSLIRVRDGSVLNLTRLTDGVAQVQDRYNQDGYIFNVYTPSEERDDSALTIAYTLNIVERPRAHIENIIIRGNEKTQDNVILREIPLEVGDIFSTARIREGMQNLYNLQYFSSVNPEFPYGSAEGLMDLVVNVEEAQTADVKFGVAFGGSTEFPVSAQVGWSDTNYRGEGQTVGFNVQASPIEQLVSLNFLERWFTGRRWSLGADITVNRTVQNGVPQDILAPIFSADDLNAVPDPFIGYYVFSHAVDDYGGQPYDAGDPFPDPVTEELIDQYDLVTDYVFAGGSSAIPDEYLMNYREWSISLGANTGYRFRTAIGQLTLSTSLRTSFNYIGYDPSQFRPFDAELRTNLDDWQWITRWGITATLDQRRGISILSPTSGYAVSQGVTFVGGFLLGDRHYIRTDTRGEAYITLWDIPVWDRWNYKTILALHSDISFILPTFWVPAAYRSMEQPVAGTDLLRTNMMFIARGWDPVTGGEALWNNWVEFRTPIAENILWLDSFFDAVNLWEDPSQIGTMGIENMLFGFGTGIRFTIPQFPIRLYLAKRFRFDESGSIQWQQGTLFNYNDSPTGGLDFVFAIGADLF